MSTIAIDLNDASIVVADAAGVRLSEPGYAFVDAGRIVTGQQAYANARLHPRRSANRYWERLSLDAGSAGLDAVGSAAELAIAQLRSLWERAGGSSEDVLVMAPGHYDRSQLGILLGLLQECGIGVSSLVNPAVAAAVQPYRGCQLVHVDAGLHRVSVTPLEQGDQVSALTARSIDSIGLAAIRDMLAKRVAELFVLETRFDPFHSAASEQQVYERLPAWLTELRRSSGRLELHLPREDEDLSVEVEREQLLGVTAGFHRAIVQLIAQARDPGERLVILLSDRLAELPGLINELERLDDSTVVPLEAGEAAVGVARHAAAISKRGGEVRLLKRLPWRESGATVSPSRAESTARSEPATNRNGLDDASHVVYGGVAYAVDGTGLLIGREQSGDRATIVLNGGQGGVSRAHCEIVRRDGELKLVDLSRFGTFVNEKRVSGETVLHVADVIRIGSPGEQIQVIRMRHAHGS